MTEHTYMDRLGSYYYGSDASYVTHEGYLKNNEWPKAAAHSRNDFKCQYNSAKHLVFAYTFL